MKLPLAVVFDLDGTMIDNHEYHHKAWAEFCVRHNIVFDVDTFYRQFGGTNKEILKELFGTNLSDEDIRKYADEKENIYRELYKGKVRPVEGLREFIKMLAGIPCKLAIATSAPVENVTFILHELRMENIFSVIVHAGMITYSKPHPEIFLKASSLLNLKGNECIAVEDTQRGIESAKAAGMKTLGILTSGTKDRLKDADKIIKNYREITPEVLSGIINPA
jgi:HAD superfamily hydrolase (TIGR01509 family)